MKESIILEYKKGLNMDMCYKIVTRNKSFIQRV